MMRIMDDLDARNPTPPALDVADACDQPPATPPAHSYRIRGAFNSVSRSTLGASSAPLASGPGDDWQTVDQAARRLRKSPGHVRRLCRWLAVTSPPLAYKVRGGGQRSRWLIRPDAALPPAGAIGRRLRELPPQRPPELAQP